MTIWSSIHWTGQCEKHIYLATITEQALVSFVRIKMNTWDHFVRVSEVINNQLKCIIDYKVAYNGLHIHVHCMSFWNWIYIPTNQHPNPYLSHLFSDSNLQVFSVSCVFLGSFLLCGLSLIFLIALQQVLWNNVLYVLAKWNLNFWKLFNLFHNLGFVP